MDTTLPAFLTKAVFPNIRNNATIKNNLAAFVECFDSGTAPAVGYTRTLTLTNITSLIVSNDWSLLENQAAISNSDLIARGTIDGQLHGLLYEPLANNYK